ncbi:hypothetical protein J7T55_009595 [Diaporthe amygdali]|uniref:uncharacterized protein n=1 Tax=Phomopsis amygdali TaxID=1214568 RepID=UPI0022FF35DB|nr:uncharacterized protein J7T55_009595 [Diaporthe amygdali]KAJ0109264.1 hypothetical protein J7T55_009595 [Diaporthe amygdali]
MSLPPEIIQVKRLVKKRKATDDDDDGVVDFLRVDGDRKRARGNDYIYQRRTDGPPDIESSTGRKPPSGLLPVIHASKPGDENHNVKKSNHAQESKPVATPRPLPTSQDEAPAAPSTQTGAHSVSKLKAATEPRKFHMSRASLVPSPLFSPGVTTGKRSRYKTPTTVFVERGHKRTRTEDVQMHDADNFQTAKSHGNDDTHARKQKLPGADRKGAEGKHAQTVKRQVPESLRKEQDSDMDEITRSMNEFVLQQIGENLAKIEERDRKVKAAAAKRASSVTSPQSSKFRPKAPSKRYAERHPEVATAQTNTTSAMPHQDEYESLSEDEYVIETYVRVAAESLGKDLAAEKVGLLVFDNEPDVDFFYGEEGDSDDEWPEDDEDENAEDYYAADYPDEEVDSEDEYNRAAYQYRTGNASDLEEFDEREDGIILDYGVERDGEPDSSLARFGARPPGAFRGS